MLFQRMKRKNKIIMAFVLSALIFVALLLFLRGSEDDWICVSGKWIMHGHPSAPMPTSLCR
jgi:hypothetical protein